MNPLSNGQAGRATVYPFNPSGRAASGQPGSPAGADAKQRFIDEVTRGINGDARLKELNPNYGLAHEELVDLVHERDRLAQICTDDAAALELAPHLSEPVARLLKRALAAAGVTVVDHQASQDAQPGPVRIHAQPAEMKRPLSSDDDAVVGPGEGHVPLVAANPAAASAASLSATKKSDAIEDLLNKWCRQARSKGNESYVAASRARDVVVLAAMKGATGVTADLPADIVTQLAGLGLTCRPSAPVTPGPKRVPESKDSPELAEQKKPAVSGDAAQLGSGPKIKIKQKQIDASRERAGGDVRADLFVGLADGKVARVKAAMAKLKAADLSPERFAEIVSATCPEGHPGFYFALQDGHEGAVTAFMEGLSEAGLSPKLVANIVCARNSDDCPGFYWALREGHAATVKAFMKGLAGAGLSSEQVAQIVVAKNPEGESGLYWALRKGHAAAVKAFMNGLSGLGLSPQQVAEIVTVPRLTQSISSLSADQKVARATALMAYKDALKGLRKQNLLTAEQEASIAAPITERIALLL
ncbi:hypothetical protein [Caenimonas koreensis]|uniref:hypothetical protein n=1 Tax=Caenimonas koreensis TaxID=367474 RepID=UPI003784C370